MRIMGTDAQRFDVPPDFTRLINEHKDALGWSLRRVAREADVSVSFLSRILSGERGIPDDAVLTRLARALRIQPVEMIYAVGRIPERQRRRAAPLLRLTKDLTESDYEQVIKVAEKLVRKRRGGK